VILQHNKVTYRYSDILAVWKQSLFYSCACFVDLSVHLASIQCLIIIIIIIVVMIFFLFSKCLIFIVIMLTLQNKLYRSKLKVKTHKNVYFLILKNLIYIFYFFNNTNYELFYLCNKSL